MEELDRYRAAQAAMWLEEVKAAGLRRESCIEELRELREDMISIKGIDYSRGPGGALNADAILDAMVRLEERERRYTRELAAYEALRNDARERLLLMRSAECSECLKRRYLLRQEWADVCEGMGYSRDGMMKLRRRALAEAWEVMPLRLRDPMHPAV